MTTKVPTWRRRLKRMAVDARNMPLRVMIWGAIIGLETMTAGTIFESNKTLLTIGSITLALAFVEAAISITFGLLASEANLRAQAFKGDPRQEVQKRAFGARCLALALLIIPVGYLANAYAFQAQMADWREYSGSEAQAMDRKNAEDYEMDSRERMQAAVNLERGIRPTHADLGKHPEMLFVALLLYVSVTIASGALWQPRPETEREAEHRRKMESSEKRRVTREANLKAKAEAERLASGRPSWFRGITFGRKVA